MSAEQVGDGNHRCKAGSRCVNATVTVDGKDKKRIPAPTEKPDTLCDSCIRRVRNAVEDLPFDYVALHVSLGEQALNGANRVQSSMSHPLPIDKHKYALMTAISDNLDRAAEIVSDALNCNPPEGSEAQRVDRAARMVSPHVDKLVDAGDVALWAWESCDDRCGRNGCDAGEHLRLTDKSGVQFAQTLLELHRSARSALGEFEKLIRLRKFCGNCAAPWIFQDPATNKVFCRECGSDWTEELHGLAGRLSKQKEEELDKQERTKLWLEAEKLLRRAEAAEERADRLQRGFEAASNPDFASMTAGQFAQVVLQETA